MVGTTVRLASMLVKQAPCPDLSNNRLPAPFALPLQHPRMTSTQERKKHRHKEDGDAVRTLE